MKINVDDIAYHRNGIGGVGFHVVTFAFMDEGDSGWHNNMLAVVYEDSGYVSVLDMDVLPNVEFTVNSWRGDNFEPALRRAINTYRELQAQEVGG